MTDEPGRQATEPKKPYSRPRVSRVTLRPEEAVLSNCKTATISGPGQPSCTSPSACSAVGS